MTDYADRESLTTKNQLFNKIDYFFTAIFIAEMVLKIIAMGFIWHRRAYLRDAWNWLDFFFTYCSSNSNSINWGRF